MQSKFDASKIAKGSTRHFVFAGGFMKPTVPAANSAVRCSESGSLRIARWLLLGLHSFDVYSAYWVSLVSNDRIERKVQPGFYSGVNVPEEELPHVTGCFIFI